MAGRPEEYFEALRHSGRPRRPHEYFDRDRHPDIVERLAYREMPEAGPQPEPSPLWTPLTYDRYLQDVLERGTTPNGVFGAKLMWGYLHDFCGLLDNVGHLAGLSVPDKLAGAFPRLRYIRITRREKVRQAVSLWKAVQTQAWRADDRGRTDEPTYDGVAIEHLVRQLVEHDAAWTGYFTGLGIQPLSITYEELASAHEQVIQDVLAHLEIEAPGDLAERIDAPRLEVQADALSEEWVRRYRAERARAVA